MKRIVYTQQGARALSKLNAAPRALAKYDNDSAQLFLIRNIGNDIPILGQQFLPVLPMIQNIVAASIGRGFLVRSPNAIRHAGKTSVLRISLQDRLDYSIPIAGCKHGVVIDE
jgi:hypothetical protein